MELPIKIKRIIWAGGACPYQIEAETECGQFFYLRYRGGRIRAGVSPTEQDFSYTKNSYNVIDIQCGDPLDGCINEKEHRPLLKGKVIFPSGFVLGYDTYLNKDSDTINNI